MEISSSETVAWLTDPANWSGPSGIPDAAPRALVLSGGLAPDRHRDRAADRALAGHTRRGHGVAVNLANLGRALPSLAVIALVLPITAAIDPATRVQDLPDAHRDGRPGHPADPRERPGRDRRGRHRPGRGGPRHGHARAIRSSDGVEIPVALPVILGGIRSAAVPDRRDRDPRRDLRRRRPRPLPRRRHRPQDDGMLFGGVVLVAGLSLVTEAVLRAAPAAARLARPPNPDRDVRRGCAPTRGPGRRGASIRERD